GYGRGGGIGRLVGDGIDRRAADTLDGNGVGMDGNEKVGVVPPRDPHPFVERQETIVVAGHVDAVFTSFLQRVPEFPAEFERYVLLDRAGYAFRAAVDTAMAGVDDDGEGLAGGVGLDVHRAGGCRGRLGGAARLFRQRRLEIRFRRRDDIDDEAVAGRGFL